MDHFDQALKLIKAGRLDEAGIYIEELPKQGPKILKSSEQYALALEPTKRRRRIDVRAYRTC